MQQQKDSLPEFTTFRLRERPADQIQCGEIFMDHYLVLLLQDLDGKSDYGLKYPKHYGRAFISSLNGMEPTYKVLPTTLLTVDLRDNSIQEVKLDESFFPGMQDCTYTKYKDNQIIKFGGHTNKMVRITIESFEPLSAKCEEIKVKGEQPKLYGHIAHIYNDYLYVYGGIHQGTVKNDLWSFDLGKNLGSSFIINLSIDTLSWKICPSSGQKSIDIYTYQYRSFIIQNKLYAFQGESKNTKFDIVDLDTMMWTRLLQKEDLSRSFTCAVFGNNLIVLKYYDLCCWNADTNSWSTFKIKQHKFSNWIRNSTVYKNFLVVTGLVYGQIPSIELLDLTCLGLSIPEEPAPEKKVPKSLFMSEEESDIKFKVQDQVIPAHKKVLIEKSKYFAGLFNSGMTESRQPIIEIPDCDPLVFQEFLKFLYNDEVKLNEDLAIKLFPFADKYLKSDLSEKCVDYLKHKINSFNVYKILDFARQQDISLLKTWCLDLLKRISADTIFELAEYLNKPTNPEFAQEDLELRNLALAFVMNNFIEISKDQKASPKFYEDFLIKNIAFDTIVDLGKFIYGHYFKRGPSQNKRPIHEHNLRERIQATKALTSDHNVGQLQTFEDRLKDIEKVFQNRINPTNNEFITDEQVKEMIRKLEESIDDYEFDIKMEMLKSMGANLRAAIMEFVQTNFQALFERNIAKELPNVLLVDLILPVFGNKSQNQTS